MSNKLRILNLINNVKMIILLVRVIMKGIRESPDECGTVSYP